MDRRMSMMAQCGAGLLKEDDDENWRYDIEQDGRQ
jgi:hypothetical protein